MTSRYGTGELYGFDFSTLPPEKVRQLSSANHRDIECPFKAEEEETEPDAVGKIDKPKPPREKSRSHDN